MKDDSSVDRQECCDVAMMTAAMVMTSSYGGYGAPNMPISPLMAACDSGYTFIDEVCAYQGDSNEITNSECCDQFKLGFGDVFLDACEIEQIFDYFDGVCMSVVGPIDAFGNFVADPDIVSVETKECCEDHGRILALENPQACIPDPNETGYSWYDGVCYFEYENDELTGPFASECCA